MSCLLLRRTTPIRHRCGGLRYNAASPRSLSLVSNVMAKPLSGVRLSSLNVTRIIRRWGLLIFAQTRQETRTKDRHTLYLKKKKNIHEEQTKEAAPGDRPRRRAPRALPQAPRQCAAAVRASSFSQLSTYLSSPRLLPLFVSERAHLVPRTDRTRRNRSWTAARSPPAAGSSTRTTHSPGTGEGGGRVGKLAPSAEAATRARNRHLDVSQALPLHAATLRKRTCRKEGNTAPLTGRTTERFKRKDSWYIRKLQPRSSSQG